VCRERCERIEGDGVGRVRKIKERKRGHWKDGVRSPSEEAIAAIQAERGASEATHERVVERKSGKSDGTRTAQILLRTSTVLARGVCGDD
jgi:hypothetical protein